MRLLGFLVRNWPLKIAAIGLATLLYAGFVVSRESESLQGPIEIIPLLDEDATIIERLPAVQTVRYSVVGSGVPSQLAPENFVAEVDLRGVPRNQTVPVTVRVRSPIVGVIVQQVEPATITVRVEDVISRHGVPVEIQIVPPPADIQLGELTTTPAAVSIRGARSRVDLVERVTQQIAIEAAALDIDTTVEPTPVDANNVPVVGVTVEPRTVRVTLVVIADNSSRNAVPIALVSAGQPAPGYHVTGVEFEPATVTVLGDADDLAVLLAIDTVPVELEGQTESITRMVELAVPAGLRVANVQRVTARITIEVETTTRTFGAGFELVGADPAFTYQVSAPSVTLTLFGPVLELDRIAQAPLLVDLDVTGLLPGTHEVSATPRIPAALSATTTNPSAVSVTIAPATPPGSASPGSGSAP